MKKNKLILLTVLIVLAVYCGAVIFITKPESFAYDSLFRDIDVTVQVPSSEKAEADAKAERDALLADVEAIAEQKAQAAGKAAVDEAVSISEKAIDEATADIAAKYEAAIDEAVADVTAKYEAAIKDAIDEALAGVDSKIDAAKPEIVDAAVAAIEANLNDYVPEIAQALYQQYGDELTSMIEKAVADALADYQPAAAEQTSGSDMSQEEYNTLRNEAREAEINSLLSQLEN